MRFGNWRGAVLVLGAACAVAALFGTATSAKADGFACTIPDLVPAVNLNTGQPYMAPPIPGGCYTGGNHLDKLAGHVNGLGAGLHGLGGGHGAGCGIPVPGGCGLGGHGAGCGLGGMGCGKGVFPSKQCLPSKQCPKPTAQCVKPSGQCASAQCGLLGKHGLPGCCLLGGGLPCGGCGGAGCGLCSGAKGLLGALGGLGGGHKIKWFVGPGGPVPITPGYTPYVVTTRSPRDFLSFPPFNPEATP